MHTQGIFSILPVTCHTRHIGVGSTFVAIKGMKDDGVKYIEQAIMQGAKTIVIESTVQLSPNIEQLASKMSVAIHRVSDTRHALATLSAQAHDNPAKKLKIIAVTGTKGKTTTTFLIEHILRIAGYKTAFLSTVKNSICSVDYPTHMTTQQPDYLHAFLRQCVDEKVEYVVMEVAAQAFTLHRVEALQFEVGLFLNFSQEHGEFYQTMDDYFAAKIEIINHIRPGGVLILNADDERVSQLNQSRVKTNWFSNKDQWNGSLDGVQFESEGVHYSCTALVGEFNVSNMRAALSCVRVLGIEPGSIQQALSTFKGVPGRLDRHVLPNGAVAYIDYAHTPSSFSGILRALRSFAPHMIVVFGAGGDRDKTKRPMMGAIVGQYADCMIITSDNPRSENPSDIAQAIKEGVAAQDAHKVIVELNRERAIRRAYDLSSSGSMILLLGKGPDEYQEISGVKTYFSEKKILHSLE